MMEPLFFEAHIPDRDFGFMKSNPAFKTVVNFSI